MKKKRSTAVGDPPKEAVAIVCTIFLLGIYHLPSVLSRLDEIAQTPDIIAQPLFPEIISKFTLAYIRLSVATFFASVTLYRYFMVKQHSIIIPYLKSSKLKRVPISLNGIRSQIPFTQWCFNMLTFSFVLNGLITLQVAYQESGSSIDFLQPLLQNNWIRSAILLFEISAPCSMLVSSVTKYALWPNSLKNGTKGSINFRKPVALIQHNCNIFVSLLEVGFLGILPIRIEDAVIAPLYGSIYVFFVWSIRNHLAETGDTQYVYFFLDTTISIKFCVQALIGLLSVLLLFYGAFTLVDDVLLWLDGNIFMHLFLTLAATSFFCRFRD
ncbi:hypothetical protein CTEN210_12740 [Chaetoceros tenuissimus]|uniref:Uncharacterized protein n=1 Tax=Chaetoceros tenuissimus TaxID=426638 RepID=A0AAD3D575_9STRA|nr:hypothetical protein CTEN210_12740 [Chaetoceros tenuissimus]